LSIDVPGKARPAAHSFDGSHTTVPWCPTSEQALAKLSSDPQPSAVKSLRPRAPRLAAEPRLRSANTDPALIPADWRNCFDGHYRPRVLLRQVIPAGEEANCPGFHGATHGEGFVYVLCLFVLSFKTLFESREFLLWLLTFINLVAETH
jgi:hypothetical protein